MRADTNWKSDFEIGSGRNVSWSSVEWEIALNVKSANNIIYCECHPM